MARTKGTYPSETVEARAARGRPRILLSLDATDLATIDAMRDRWAETSEEPVTRTLTPFRLRPLILKRNQAEPNGTFRAAPL